MKSPNVPVLAVTLLVLLLLLLLASGRYSSLIPLLTTATEEESVSVHDESNKSASNASLLLEPSTRKTCIVYERPPRTGSTTIGEAMRKCLVSRGYHQAQWKGYDARADGMPDMLRLPQKRVMSVTLHFYMNVSTLRQLQTGCKSLLYITSTAPMKQRLWSYVKYEQTPKHGNSSLNEEQMKEAIETLKREKNQIMVLNSYPYLHNLRKAVDMGKAERLVPDYVIRKSKLVSDLSALLGAFGCPEKVISKNVHHARNDDVLQNIEIDDDDALHSQLLRYAQERNEQGLKKASEFAR